MAFSSPQLAAVVIGAGKGTRMRSPVAKVLHPLAGRPLIAHVLEAVLPLHPQCLVTVVGHQADAVRTVCANYGTISVLQEPQLGTGHAVAQAEPVLAHFSGDILILYGDVPMLRTATMQRLWEEHRCQQATVTVLTAILDNPSGYGRMLRDAQGRICGIVEDKDASQEQKAIREINTGVYCLNAAFLFAALRRIGRHNAQGEQYLTDVVSIAVQDGLPVASLTVEDINETLGVNTPEDLARLEALLK